MSSAGPDRSRMPRISPVAEKMGAAWQLRMLLQARKCSAPWMRTARPSCRAVPMALVPRRGSAQLTPGCSATRRALSWKLRLPRSCRIRPLASASSTTLCAESPSAPSAPRLGSARRQQMVAGLAAQVQVRAGQGVGVGQQGGVQIGAARPGLVDARRRLRAGARRQVDRGRCLHASLRPGRRGTCRGPRRRLSPFAARCVAKCDKPMF